MKKLYQRLATKVNAVMACEAGANLEWAVRHREEADRMCREYMPHGSGFDGDQPIIIEWGECELGKEVLPLAVSFHPMNENGYYEPWVNFTVEITPSLAYGYKLEITGNELDEALEDYIVETLHAALNQEVPLPEPTA